jgi:hypothetical protein
MTQVKYIVPFVLVVVQCALAVPRGAAADDLASLVRQFKAVRAEGEGNSVASQASRELATHGPDAIVPLLKAMDDAGAIAANWLRAAVDSIAERTIAANNKLPAADLERFVLDQQHGGRARRLAFEWLAKADATAPDRLIPAMLNDPGLELRRDAVAYATNQAQALSDADDKPAARAAFQKAFAAARDHDQVLELAKRLESLGESVNLTRHFGCVQRWHVIAPFDNTDKSGFDHAYPPETKIDLAAEYVGKSNDGVENRLRWVEHTATDPFGIVDLNKVIGKHMGVVAYATTEVDSSRQQPVRIHVGSNNAIKLWLNGERIYTRDEYHHGMSMDQYQATGTLKPGRNTILLKVCQNEQKDDWAQSWSFQLRVCDPTGGGIGVIGEK